MSEATRKFRPRNPEATKELLLTSATEEFAEYGPAGARVDRIADRASTNKRMIYAYFGDKDGLFDAVLERHIADIAAAAPFDPADLGAFAAARFDFMLANPLVRRLATWRTFDRGEPTGAERDSYRVPIEAIAAAQRAGRVDDSIPAADLFAIVLRISESWLSAPPALHAATDGAPLAPERLAAHRAALIEAVHASSSRAKDDPEWTSRPSPTRASRTPSPNWRTNCDSSAAPSRPRRRTCPANSCWGSGACPTHSAGAASAASTGRPGRSPSTSRSAGSASRARQWPGSARNWAGSWPNA
jgi:AcrR family transcriptional regulator